MQYSEERKASVLKKMIPPHNQSLAQLAVQEGISEATLYNWRKEARSKGYEQAYKNHHTTKTGFPRNVIESINVNRTDERGASHAEYFKEKEAELKASENKKIRICKMLR